ncbi:hypothetical protein MMC24_003661 [Lignoscripta atroalba]|nr:hypothetical protein [Lignoscripta atroalba]
MGWLWSDAQIRANTEVPAKQQDESTPMETSPPPPPVSTDIADRPRRLTREEQAEAELQDLLKEFNNAAEDSLPSSALQDQTLISQINHSSISPDSLYPTTMSCRAAFDSAFHCQSLGGQFTNLYRHGGVRNCSDQWHNFWFCMRTNRGMMSEEDRKKRIQEHYRGRAAKYKAGPSSEDVWNLREERLEGAFEGDLEALEEEIKRSEKEGT